MGLASPATWCSGIRSRKNSRGAGSRGRRRCLEVTIFFQLLWLLCGLGSATFAVSTRGWKDVCLLTAGLASTLMVFWTKPLPDPALVGGTAAVVAGWQLLRARTETALPFFAGVLAALTVLALRAQEIPVAFCVLGILPAVAAAALAGRRRDFASEDTRNEALLLVIALALITALAPGLTDGWQSATGLNMQDNKTLAPMIPGWVLSMAALSAVTGGVFAVWRRS